ncbi:MAG: proton-conducting transporter membrane subunit [Bacteroidales bacterium]|jgi:multicomponent Na+:H+ antiporter subunit A|nr:proton-conducting transporter membrane subunit [Bacteroidales bacterium]
MAEKAATYLPLLTGLIFLAGVFSPLLIRLFRKRLGMIVALIPLLIFISLLFVIPSIGVDSVIITGKLFTLTESINLAFRLDGLSITFGLLITGIGAFVFLYSAFYMAKYERQGQFYLYLTLFMGAMTAMVFADNLMALFIFWEITSVTSFLLIGFDYHSEKARQASLQSLLITGFGGLCLLFAVILAGEEAGTYNISEMISSGFTLESDSRTLLIFIMVLMAVLTKSAQFPFHFWLPGAMQAPTPVSSYLHSATMVNAGIFLLLRLHPLLGDFYLWRGSLMVAGGITMFLGAFFSMGQTDLKRILAFTTISALGTMVMLIGIDTSESMKAALVFFIVHALYKGGLFMMAGIIDKSTGTRDIKLLARLGRGLPLTTVATILSLVSMAGLPPMLGFIGKELMYDAKIQLPGLAQLVLPLGVGANIMMVAISMTIFAELFTPAPAKKGVPFKYRERDFPWYFPAGTILLAAAGLLLGLVPGNLDMLIGNALVVAGDYDPGVKLSLWHGFNDVFFLSVFTIISGSVVFTLRRKVMPAISSVLRWFDRLFLPDLFMKVMKRYLEITARNTARIQHGYHRYYLMTFFLVTLALAAIPFLTGHASQVRLDILSPVRLNIVLLLLISGMAVVFAVFTGGRLTAIVAMAVVGYGIGLLYLFYGAVDLAITQFLAETILMVLFVMVMYRMPGFAPLSSRRSRLRDIAIALAVGVMVAVVVLNALAVNLSDPISSFYAENSLTQGHGRNIVNVILVDFRALDTLGEITVLTLAAVGVYALFNIRVSKLKKKEEEP